MPSQLKWSSTMVTGLLFALFSYVGSGTHTDAKDVSIVQIGSSQLDLNDLKRHVSTLASDSLEGREAGSRGGRGALAYLRSELQRMRKTGKVPPEQVQEFGREFQNLLVVFPGSDERLKQEVIVVGAHYDHVGYGSPSNSKGPLGQVHNGADDNASGTSAVLEMIQAFSALELSPGRTVMFAFWDAEEVGLLGSRHWVSHPTIPLERVRFAMNIDMLGRLRDQRLVTTGWRSAAGLRTMLATQNLSNQLTLSFQGRINADSDHFPFFAASIPVIHIDTDKHDDYHRPSDDPERINWDGLLQITEFAFRFIVDAASRREFPAFRDEVNREPIPIWLSPASAVAAPVRLGVTWDADLAKKNVAKVIQVNPESPAGRSGLQIGDRILRLGPWENGSFEDLKTVLQIVKNPVAIRIERSDDNVPIDAEINLWGNPVKLGAGWVDDNALPGCVVISHVMADSPANRAGIQTGDVVMQFNGKPVGSSEQLRQRVLDEPGPFVVRIERSGRIRDVTVDLFEKPKTILPASNRR